ncbi:MAG TPA: helix-turn-helix transcriptional regulator [Dysgonamonadaceae bacterium]|nr:helix-turn-helix transcriptional regulator [Dysgonamonadaceae bacterium]
MTEKEKLGKYLLNLRKEIPSNEYKNEHMSQQEFADNNTGLTKFLVGSVERGKANPTLDKLIFLAKGLNLKKINLFDIQIDVDKYIKELKKK